MRGWQPLIALACAVCGAACGPQTGADAVPPSVLLVVLDTTRRDAVSAYGAVEGTTPYLDELAAEGLRYDWALAPAPWTLPSHATLFTSLGPEHHGVGIGGRMVLGSEFATLAETLAAAGYQTAGFSENPLLMSEFGLDRGFDVFGGEMNAVRERARAAGNPQRRLRFDVSHAVRTWAGERDPERPFFVFVNLFDPHDPFVLHETNDFLPASVDRKDAARLGRGKPTQGVADFAGICSRLPPPSDLEILRALYLGEVSAADAKLRSVHQTLREAAGGRLVTVVTADHGEHLGEHRLLGHEFSLRAELLRVPLVVHGLPGAPPAVLDARVGLGDVAPSLLHWAGIDPAPSFQGEPLPHTAAQVGAERSWVAAFSDTDPIRPSGIDILDFHMERKRRGCTPRDRVFGGMLSLVRFPYKLIWYEQASPQLYDLRWDEREVSDLASQQPGRVARMSRQLEGLSRRMQQTPAGETPAEAVEALRALGYVE